MLNAIVGVDGDTAASRSTFLVAQATDTVPFQPIVAGRYYDRFARDADGWFFTERKADVEMVGDVSDHLLIAGGVAANSRLRELAEERCAAAGLTLRIPRPRLCTDNGAMIASFAAHLIAAGAPPSPLDVPSDPGLPVVTGQVA